MRFPIYSYAKARELFNTTNGSAPVDPGGDPNITKKAFLRQPLYDRLPVSAAGGNQVLQFFTTLGGKFKTNMQLQGQLPSGQDFLAYTISTKFIPGVPNSPAASTTCLTRSEYVNDMATVYDGGYAEINILSATWLTIAPMMMMPFNSNLQGAAAIGVADTNATTAAIAETNIVSPIGEVYDLNGLWIPSTTNFSVDIHLNFDSLPSGVDGELIVELDGVMYRNIQ